MERGRKRRETRMKGRRVGSGRGKGGSRQLYGEGTGLAVVEVGEWAGSGNGMRRG